MSWWEEAKKLAAATILVMENTDADTAARRMAICQPCEWMDRANKKCSICGCFLDGKTWSKVSRSKNRPLGEVTHCPMGKWGDMDIANHYRKLDGLPPLGESPNTGPELEDHFFF